ncbi:hypothetical protein [Synechococcus sp. MU1642]|nr:hypothetical protein [Synechococcus sp. MU1642]
MRTLFVYPEFPKTFWSYEKILDEGENTLSMFLDALERGETG